MVGFGITGSIASETQIPRKMGHYAPQGDLISCPDPITLPTDI